MQHIQDAITFWCILILATGGFIKQSKSQVGLLCFRFVNGKLTLKEKTDLPSFQFTIPQKDGKDVPPILIVSVMKGTKSLGVKFDLENKCLHQVDKLIPRALNGCHVSAWGCTSVLTTADVATSTSSN